MNKKQVGNNKSDNGPAFAFQLFITGATPNSMRAVNNIREICESYLKGQYALEIIDVYKDPLRAQQEQLVALPLLVKLRPVPIRKLVGDLSDRKKVMDILGIRE